MRYLRRRRVSPKPRAGESLLYGLIISRVRQPRDFGDAVAAGVSAEATDFGVPSFALW